jgi:hypothetical protein
LFYLPDLKAIVVGDVLSSNKPGGAKFNMQYTIMNNCGNEAITVNGSGASQVFVHEILHSLVVCVCVGGHHEGFFDGGMSLVRGVATREPLQPKRLDVRPWRAHELQ